MIRIYGIQKLLRKGIRQNSHISKGVLKQSDSEAYLWACRAAKKGLSKAEHAVGYYAGVGVGIKQDIEMAK